MKPIGLCTAFNYIDRQWRSDYRNDLEFGRFTAKSFCTESSKMEEGTLTAVLEVDNAVCEQIDATMPKFYGEVARAAGYRLRDEYGGFVINAVAFQATAFGSCCVHCHRRICGQRYKAERSPHLHGQYCGPK